MIDKRPEKQQICHESMQTAAAVRIDFF